MSVSEDLEVRAVFTSASAFAPSDFSSAAMSGSSGIIEVWAVGLTRRCSMSSPSPAVRRKLALREVVAGAAAPAASHRRATGE